MHAYTWYSLLSGTNQKSTKGTCNINYMETMSKSMCDESWSLITIVLEVLEQVLSNSSDVHNEEKWKDNSSSLLSPLLGMKPLKATQWHI